MEGTDPSFTIVPGTLRNTLYGLRLIAGLGMLFSSLDWFIAAAQIDRTVDRDSMTTKIGIPGTSPQESPA